jgi:hypothetical protein
MGTIPRFFAFFAFFSNHPKPSLALDGRGAERFFLHGTPESLELALVMG